MWKKLTALTLTLALTACGAKGADPDAAVHTLHGAGLEIHPTLFEKYGKGACDMAEKGTDFDTLVRWSRTKVMADQEQGELFVLLSVAVYCPNADI